MGQVHGYRRTQRTAAIARSDDHPLFDLIPTPAYIIDDETILDELGLLAAIECHLEAFERQSAIRTTLSHGSLGLRGVYERAELLDGTVDIRPHRPRGVVVSIQIPLGERQQRPATEPE